MDDKLTRGELVMMHFMCRLGWAMRYSDIGSNIILDFSVRVFGDWVNI